MNERHTQSYTLLLGIKGILFIYFKPALFPGPVNPLLSSQTVCLHDNGFRVKCILVLLSFILLFTQKKHFSQPKMQTFHPPGFFLKHRSHHCSVNVSQSFDGKLTSGSTLHITLLSWHLQTGQKQQSSVAVASPCVSQHTTLSNKITRRVLNQQPAALSSSTSLCVGTG